MLKDELLGLADSPESDQVFKSHGLNMDVLYRTGETQQVDLFFNPTLLLYYHSPSPFICCSFVSYMFICAGHSYIHTAIGLGWFSR